MQAYARKWIWPLTLLCFTAGLHAAPLQDDKKADIERLMQMTGATRIGMQIASAMVAQMTQAVKKSRPDISPQAMTVMQKTVMEVMQEKVADRQGLLGQIVELYHKHFSHDDIKGLIAFYESDLGRKTVKEMPKLAGESIRIGRQWGARLGPEIEQRVGQALKRLGYSLNKPKP